MDNAPKKIVNAQVVSVLPAQRNNPLRVYQEQLAKTLFEQTHLVWTREEIDEHWSNVLNLAEVSQYRYLAQISIDFLFPRMERL